MTRARWIQLVCLAVIVCCAGASTWLSTRISVTASNARLSYTERVEDNAPPQVGLGIAMGAFRGLFVNMLWIRANNLKDEGRFHESMELARAITTLQPRFPRVWVFQAWNMAYNISVATQTPSERWEWVQSGIRLLRDEGIPANPDDMLLHKELGWIFLHKIGGYTDDANQTYKRMLAAEWQEILGAPPEFDYSNRDRAARTAQYERWLRPMVDAPDTLAALRQRNPAAANLAQIYTDRLGEPPGKEMLRRAAVQEALERYGRIEAIRRAGGPMTRAFDALYNDPAHAAAWPDLLAYARKRVIVDEYHMEPLRMLRTVQDFGPVDWRLPATHALYWSYRGVREGQMEVNERNSDAFDFVNTYRIVVQSLQELWRYGELYFNYLEVHEGRPGYYQAVPNPDFLESYGEILDEAIAQSGIFEGEKRPYRAFAAGYENLMEDAVSFYYRRGDFTNAERWYQKLRTWEGANVHAVFDRTERLSLPLEEFVAANLHDRYDSPTVVVQEVYAALDSAFYEGLLMGDSDVFEGMFDYARKQHAFFMQAQFRQIAAGGASARTEYLDRDFRFVAGMFFAQHMLGLPPDEAELMYYNAPEDLRRFAYAALVQRYRQLLEQTGDDRTVEELFPEPTGMAQFNAWLTQELNRRSEQGIEGVMEK